MYYLWNDKMPTTIDNTKESDPEQYFYKLLYTSKDKWSYITPDYASLEAELSGTPSTMGYYPAFYLVGGNKVIIAVCYVYPGSPAADAGLKRGNLILSIDNATLDTTNYYTKYSGTSYTAQLGQLVGSSLSLTGVSINMTARVVNTDPAIYHQVLDIDGHKIGYLAYVEFITGDNDAYLAKMDSIFTEFKTAGVSDLIVDLRYNPGGQIDAAAHLASDIAPVGVTTNNDILVRLVYNDSLQQYLELNNHPDYLYYKFINTTANINMTRVYFLTTSRSASASELTMTGLMPYMTVVLIGEPTYGKYVGSWVIPDDNNQWAMMPIVMKYSNANGFSDFANGLTPDYVINDDPVTAVPFGDTSDPLIGKAVELATGKTLPTIKAAVPATENFRQIVPPQMRVRDNLFIHKMPPVKVK
jgi:C-terminal processing protease CtpA/Prc